MKKTVCALLFAAIPSAAIAGPIIRCENSKAEAVTISLSASKKFGVTLHCIDGDFIADLTPCAPHGGYGLSAPTGSSGLVGIVWRWQDYGNHLGGIVSANVNRTAIYFDGGFYGGNQSWSNQWNFTVDRLSGKGELNLRAPSGATTFVRRYNCKSMAPKF